MFKKKPVDILKTGIYTAIVDQNGDLHLSDDIKTKLDLKANDFVEVSIKKIITKKNIQIQNENPLYELITK